MTNLELAQDPNTPVETLQLLATDDYYGVRYRAAHNPNATELIRRLFLMTEAKKK
jgi:hypothetical protein